MIILGDFVWVTLAVGLLDLALATTLTAAAAAFEVLVGVQAQKEQAVDFAAFQRLIGLEGLGDGNQVVP